MTAWPICSGAQATALAGGVSHSPWVVGFIRAKAPNRSRNTCPLTCLDSGDSSHTTSGELCSGLSGAAGSWSAGSSGTGAAPNASSPLPAAIGVRPDGAIALCLTPYWAPSRLADWVSATIAALVAA